MCLRATEGRHSQARQYVADGRKATEGRHAVEEERNERRDEGQTTGQIQIGE